MRKVASAIPEIRFENQGLTSFGGLVVFQALFDKLDLRGRLRACFRNRVRDAIFPVSVTVQLLVMHALLGFRELGQMRFYADDPLALRMLGLAELPNVSTVSRQLSSMDDRGVANLEQLNFDLVTERLAQTSIRHLTLDFDGSVLGTGRRAEGTAVGFDKRKKGQRSYYPLFCTVAQSGQVLSVLHRSGNVHDSNGAEEFILRCMARVKEVLPDTRIELRMDSAFFSDEIVRALENAGVHYSISVPFERFIELKEHAEQRIHWREIDQSFGYFERRWKPKKWKRRHRFVFLRKLAKVQHKQPLQLDLLLPRDHRFDYSVILTNKKDDAPELMACHHGRGSQEGIFSEFKSENAMAYIPTRTWNGNQVYLLSTVLAHNLSRELQMQSSEPVVRDDAKRPALRVFEKLGTVRREMILRAGRLLRPNGKLTLSMSDSPGSRTRIETHLAALGCPC